MLSVQIGAEHTFHGEAAFFGLLHILVQFFYIRSQGREVSNTDSEILISLLSLAGTLLGSLGGVLASSKLTNYRLGLLEKKVDRQSGFTERIPVLEEKLKVVNHRLSDLEEVKGGCRTN